MIPGLDKLIDAILGTATAQLQDRIQRSEAVIKLLKRLKLDPDHPPADFTAIYQYALIEKVEHYRQLIQELLQAYSEIKSSNEEVDAEAIFDPVRNRYQVVHVDWSNG